MNAVSGRAGVFCLVLMLISLAASPCPGTGAGDAGAGIHVETPMPPPAWALLERALLRASEKACRAYFDRYFDDRGYLLCVERWGGDDGPDDAIECVNDWPVLHALGASDEIRRLYERAWEGHLRQYTAARTTEVEFARQGMYYREFPVMFDWVHNGEGLSVFDLQGLSDPHDERFRQRVERFAGFYLNADPGAPNYDPKHRIIRSLFNGSRGPLLREAEPVEWAGDPIEVNGRFRPRHGERSYAEMLAHFKDYRRIVGDHPQNLAATSLALNAFMVTGRKAYRDWVLEYVDAWRQRTLDNGGIIPTNIGLDGTIGGGSDGKWYGGVYGWAFTVVEPQSGRRVHRNTHHFGLNGFTNAYLLTGDDRYLDVWRRQIEAINARAKTGDGRTLYPHMYGDQGWYDYTAQPYSVGALEVYYGSMRPADRTRVPENGWLAYLEGNNPGYPERALQQGFAVLREKVEAMHRDTTTPDTRLADDPMGFNPAPATAATLVNLMLGGLAPKHQGEVLHCRLRYFDPESRRPGLPPDVAALVESLGADSATVRLVNLDPSDPHTVIVQAGGYREHTFTAVEWAGRSIAVDRPVLDIALAPGAGGRLVLRMKRYVNPPTVAQPWDRD
jgi:hypothetical protein